MERFLALLGMRTFLLGMSWEPHRESRKKLHRKKKGTAVLRPYMVVRKATKRAVPDKRRRARHAVPFWENSFK